MKTNFLKLNKAKKIRGIAMVESLMAITIVIISIMGPIAISLNAAKYAKYGLYKVTASNLANEQIEMVVNYKKSLDIYCFNNPSYVSSNNISCNEDGFNIFVESLTNPASISCPLKTDGRDACYFDDTSFYYLVNSVPSLLTPQKSSCKIMIQINDIAKCDNGGSFIAGEKSIFTRKLYIDNIDTMRDTTNSLTNTTLRLISVVCINNDACTPGDKRAITVISYIYR